VDTEIAQNNKLHLLGKLNASFVHEIRNPLFAIKLNLDYLKLENGLPKDSVEAIEACLEATNRISHLIEDFLEFSRKSNSNGTACSINQLTKQAIDLVKGYANKTNLEIIKKMDNSDPIVAFDKNKLIQVFLNILTNAVESQSANNKIIVRTYKKSNKVIWEVEDFGNGIKDEDKPKIFDEFFTGKKSGTGLGLNICKKILDENNAKIDFVSSVGKGTKFYITFNSLNQAPLNEI